MKKKKEIPEIEMTHKMISQVDQVDNAAYEICCLFLNISVEEKEEKFPWNIEILAKVIDALLQFGKPVCYPYIEYEGEDEEEKASLCKLENCGCNRCVRNTKHE